MDPNEALRNMRESIGTIRRLEDAGYMDEMSKADLQRYETAVTRLTEAAEALDGWMSGGGFLPRAWMSKR